MSGKALRLKRLFSKGDGRLVVFPLDHGVTFGPIPGLRQLAGVIGMGVREGVDAFVLHKGAMAFLETIPPPLPAVLMHLSASTGIGASIRRKVLVGSVEEALCRGADGVSVHINLGGEHEPEMLRDLGSVGAACQRWQVPLLVMIYIRGIHAPSPVPDTAVAHGARVAAELGADVIKIPLPDDVELLAEIANSFPVPVIMAGGSKEPDPRLFLGRVEQALDAGFSGVAVGRNVFQNEKPQCLLRCICSMVHKRMNAQGAWDEWAGELF